MERGTSPSESGLPQGAAHRPRWRRRFAWLVAIWCASVAVLGVAAYAFRNIMGWVGLTR
jgi:hypothetical protein